MKRKLSAAAMVVLIIVLMAALLTGCGSLGKNPAVTADKSVSSSVPNKGEPSSSAADSSSQQASSVLPDFEVSFLAAGDNLIHNTVYFDANRAAGGSGYVFTQMYEDVKGDVSGSDFAYINQETILGGTALGLSNYPLFNSPQEVGDALRQTGFNLISEANNHSLDKGFTGITNACEYWKNKTGTVMDGIFENQEDSQKVRVLEKKGVKLALISDTWNTNGNAKPTGKNWCVETDFNDTLAKVKEARNQADVVLVAMHWGTEYSTKINSEQQQQAQQLADAGADIIIGNHPHVIEPVQWVTSSDNRRVIVAYAMGNFISNQLDFENMVGGMLQLKISRKDSAIMLSGVKFVPVVTYFEHGSKGVCNFKTVKLTDYTQTMAAKHALTASGVNMSPAHVQSYVKSIISPEFYS